MQPDWLDSKRMEVTIDNHFSLHQLFLLWKRLFQSTFLKSKLAACKTVGIADISASFVHLDGCICTNLWQSLLDCLENPSAESIFLTKMACQHVVGQYMIPILALAPFNPHLTIIYTLLQNPPFFCLDGLWNTFFFWSWATHWNSCDAVQEIYLWKKKKKSKWHTGNMNSDTSPILTFFLLFNELVPFSRGSAGSNALPITFFSRWWNYAIPSRLTSHKGAKGQQRSNVRTGGIH